MRAATDTAVTGQDRAFVVALDDPAAVAVDLTGGKAANLARAAVAGLDTLPGIVLTTAFSDAIDGGADVRDHPAVREAFAEAEGDTRSLVARSSSVVEDTADSSMAGQFESVIGIEGFDAFVAAVGEVLGSRDRAGAADEPIAVLVQPLIEPASGGVMFGIDPVTGSARPKSSSLLAAVLALASWRRCPRLALAIVIIALARPLTEHLLKELVGRERPQGDQLVPGRGPSFPSGHPLATAASWGLVPLVVGLYTARRAVWWTSAVLVWALAVTVAASRVWLGVHWTSDVVASLLLASLGVLAAERFIAVMHGPECGTPRPAFRRVSPPQTGRTPVP